MPYWYWYTPTEEIAAYPEGNIPNTPCPVGSYRDLTAKTRYYGTSVGLTSTSGCTVCPDGFLDVQAQCKNMEQFLDMYARTTKNGVAIAK